MSSNDSSSLSSSGIGFPGLLTIVFIILKLTDFIAWSWFWVLSPMIFSVAFGLIIMVTVGLIAVISGLIAALLD